MAMETRDGGGANTTDTPRTGIAISYRLGYTIHRPNFGCYEGRDPGVVLSGQASDAMATRDHLLDEHKALLEKPYRAA